MLCPSALRQSQSAEPVLWLAPASASRGSKSLEPGAPHSCFSEPERQAHGVRRDVERAERAREKGRRPLVQSRPRMARTRRAERLLRCTFPRDGIQDRSVFDRCPALDSAKRAPSRVSHVACRNLRWRLIRPLSGRQGAPLVPRKEADRLEGGQRASKSSRPGGCLPAARGGS